jgi:nitrogenase subunit NifH
VVQLSTLGGINKSTKQNMKAILAITAAVSLLAGCSTSSQQSRTWEYETVTGKVDNSKTDRLADKINTEANQGWKFVSSGGLEGFYGYAVLKREKK